MGAALVVATDADVAQATRTSSTSTAGARGPT
jgi:hypothetical protein